MPNVRRKAEQLARRPGALQKIDFERNISQQYKKEKKPFSEY